MSDKYTNAIMTLMTATATLAAVWSAVASSIGLRRKAPFVSIEHGGMAPRWDGFTPFSVVVTNVLPVGLKIRSISIRRNWKRPFAKRKLSCLYDQRFLGADGDYKWPDSEPNELSHTVKLAGHGVAGSKGTAYASKSFACAASCAFSTVTVVYSWDDTKRRYRTTSLSWV